MKTVTDMYATTANAIDPTSVIAVESQVAAMLEGLIDATSLATVINTMARIYEDQYEYAATYQLLVRAAARA